MYKALHEEHAESTRRVSKAVWALWCDESIDWKSRLQALPKKVMNEVYQGNVARSGTF